MHANYSRMIEGRLESGGFVKKGVVNYLSNFKLEVIVTFSEKALIIAHKHTFQQ
jgi:hypothetical protein